MTTESDQPTDYPSHWRPKAAPPPDELDPTEAELWLGSLSPAELQAVLARVRGGR